MTRRGSILLVSRVESHAPLNRRPRDVAHEVIDCFLQRAASGPMPDLFATVTRVQVRGVQANAPIRRKLEDGEVSIGVNELALTAMSN
jgi:hypothetical protein